jgi:hypothetical protein
MAAVQNELKRLGCYSAPISGEFDIATIKALTRYLTHKGSKETGEHLSDGLLSELTLQQLAVCPEPVIATPMKPLRSVSRGGTAPRRSHPVRPPVFATPMRSPSIRVDRPPEIPPRQTRKAPRLPSEIKVPSNGQKGRSGSFARLGIATTSSPGARLSERAV